MHELKHEKNISNFYSLSHKNGNLQNFQDVSLLANK